MVGGHGVKSTGRNGGGGGLLVVCGRVCMYMARKEMDADASTFPYTTHHTLRRYDDLFGAARSALMPNSPVATCTNDVSIGMYSIFVPGSDMILLRALM